MCSQDQVLPFPLPSKVVWHRGGFGQGRAPPLRAPKGSLDWSHRDADNLRGGNGRGSKGGTFLTRTKGDIIKVARQKMQVARPKDGSLVYTEWDLEGQKGQNGNPG